MTPRIVPRPEGLSVRVGRQHVVVRGWEQGFRVQASAAAEVDESDTGSLPGRPHPVRMGRLADGGWSLRTGGHRGDDTECLVGPDGRVSFHAVSGDGDRAPLLSETPVRELVPPARLLRPGPGGLWQVEACFDAGDERLYGLGQHRHGLLDQKGAVVDLEHRNAEVAIPVLVSDRGYVMVWNNPGTGRVELGRNRTRWVADGATGLDYWVGAGPSWQERYRRLTAVVGRPPAFPAYASGFWQSRLRYATQDELLGVAREFRRRDIPLAVLACDFFHWRRMGDWAFDDRAFPDPAAMVTELRDSGIELMVSVWPTLNPGSETFEAFDRHGLLVRTAEGDLAALAFVDSESEGTVRLAVYDATSAEARRRLVDRLDEGYARLGIRTYWADACEPTVSDAEPRDLRFAAGPGVAVACGYPARHTAAIGALAARDGGLVLARSAWLGSQRDPVAVWSGDVEATWQALGQQVRAGLNMNLSGIPWWSADIGGFLGGDPQDDEYAELVVRWLQYATYTPIMRLHGWREPRSVRAGGPNEPWSYPLWAYEIMVEHIRLRERLRPYVHAVMQEASRSGMPPMRPLWFHDAECAEVDDAFVFGPDLLVAPVTRPGARARTVRLPGGDSWQDVRDGRVHGGGGTVLLAAPLTHIPVLRRVGLLTL